MRTAMGSRKETLTSVHDFIKQLTMADPHMKRRRENTSVVIEGKKIQCDIKDAFNNMFYLVFMFILVLIVSLGLRVVELHFI